MKQTASQALRPELKYGFCLARGLPALITFRFVCLMAGRLFFYRTAAHNPIPDKVWERLIKLAHKNSIVNKYGGLFF